MCDCRADRYCPECFEVQRAIEQRRRDAEADDRLQIALAAAYSTLHVTSVSLIGAR